MGGGNLGAGLTPRATSCACAVTAYLQRPTLISHLNPMPHPLSALQPEPALPVEVPLHGKGG